MIETWQYLAFGVVGVVVLYLSWRAVQRSRAFWETLETTIVDALAAQQFVLTSKSHTREAFGHRFWRFARPPRAIVVYWDGKQENFAVELEEGDSPRVSKQIAQFYFPNDYQSAIDRIREAVNDAARTDAESRPAD